MKRYIGSLLWFTMFTCFSVTPVKASILDLSGIADLIAEKAKETRACSVVYYDGKVTGGAYLPVWTFTGAGLAPSYAALGVGGEAGAGSGPRPFVTFNANLPAISGKIWSSQWSRDHVIRTHLPPLWLGPTIRAPTQGEKFTWSGWKGFVGFMVSIGIGGN